MLDREQSMTTVGRGGLELRVSLRISDTVDGWVAWLEGRKVRPRAVDTYRRDHGHFAAWIGPGATVADVTAERVAAYQVSLRKQAAATVSQHLSALRSWCRYCIKIHLRSDDPTLELDWPRHGKRLPRALKTHELRLLEEVLAVEPDGLEGEQRRLWLRNCRVVLLLLYTGLRRSELAGLAWCEIDLEQRTAIVRSETAKGGNERMIVLHPRVVAELETTPLRLRRGPVIVAMRRAPGCVGVSDTTIGRIFEVWLQEFGLDISAHRLRHTCATELLRAGAGLRDVQQQLGHADIRTTEGYLDLLHEQQRQAVDRLPERFGSA